MATRDFLKHTVSATEPSGSTIGDEWYNPSTGILSKRLAVNGTNVEFVPLQGSLTVQASGTTVTSNTSILNFPGASIEHNAVSGITTITSSAIPGGSNTNIQFNNSGGFAGSNNLTWNNATNTLTVTGTVLVGSSSVVDWKNTTTQWTLSGGGLVTWTGSSLLWSQRVIAIPVERTEMGSAGYFDITCPTSGTVTYYNSAGVTTTVTCTASGIPLAAWEALYYEVTEGMAEPSSQARFRVVNYQNTVWRPGPGWILIAAVNGDAVNVGHLKWMPGQINFPAIGSTVRYDSGRGLANWFAGPIPQSDATTILNPVSSIATSGSRSVVLAPNTYNYGVFSEFKNSSAFSFTGTYTGLITYANWIGTTASTGDPSYQLAFHPSAANSTTNPRLKFRAGIDTTWGAWGEISHTGVTDLNIRHNSIGVNVAASGTAGQISTTTSNNTNIVINNSSGTDRYFINATGAVNSFSVFENSNIAYINSFSGMALRANQNGGTGGVIALSGGTVQVNNQLLDVTAATPATTNAIRARSNISWLSPAGTSTITSKMLDAGALSFEGTVGQLFSITNSMTGTIFSVNDVSGIPSIEVLDTGLIKLAQYSGFVAYGVSPALTATGSTQGTALLLTRPINDVTTVAASTGVIFPTATAGMRIVVRNGGANSLNVYPASGGQINTLGTNVAFVLTTSTVLEFIAFSTTQWHTTNSTYA